MTGSNGFIGNHLKHLILSMGFKLITISNNKYENDKNNYSYDEFFSGSTNLKIDIIIHLASLTCVRESLKKPKKYFENYKAQIKFIEYLKDTKVKYFIFSSSLSIFDEGKYKSNLSSYSKYKLMLEKYLKKKSSPNFKVIILRYPNVVGSDPSGKLGEKNSFISRIMPLFYKNLINQKKTTLFYNFKTKAFPKRNYLHVEDVANINNEIIHNIKKFKKDFSVFNLGGKKQYSNFEVLKSFSKILKKKPQYILKRISNKESMMQINNSKNSIFNYIGYKIKYRNLEKIMKTNLKWFRKIY